MNCKQLKFLPSHYITEDGHVFKIKKDGKEENIIIAKSKNGNPIIRTDKGCFKLIDLMIEYFVGPIKITDRLNYKIMPDNSIPISNITVKNFISKFDCLSKEDEILLFKYRCDIKAWSANSRDEQIITPLEVFMTLKIHDFRCLYCGKKINPDRWHLDHYYPLSINGINKFENIVPSCPRCNMMKSNIDPIQFIRHCIRISQSNLVKDISIQKLIPP